MKPIFHAFPVNPPFEDPALYIRILREGRAVLFDAGSLQRLSPGLLMDVTDVFVTHMHIDHFIGIDSLLRTFLHRTAPLTIYGPEGLTACILGKLNGYTWNLIRDYPLCLHVVEAAGGRLMRSRFSASEGFVREDLGSEPFCGALVREPLFTVSAIQLSHRIPSLGYLLAEAFHINVRKEAVEALGLSVGPWLSSLKDAVRSAAKNGVQPDAALAAVGDRGFAVGNRMLNRDDIEQILLISRGQKLAYIMDTDPTEENIAAIIQFVHSVDELYCEAYFLAADEERARLRAHLTTAHTRRIAEAAGIGKLSILHFSPKYRDCADLVYKEAGVSPDNFLSAPTPSDLE
ncbi:MAG TPA: MBL fold metallo-hydrolase [Dissulfurispiraceae bacterium]|nr:MBL fold metallo-hydrolase [Dissulfurispiraceae bacterium]